MFPSSVAADVAAAAATAASEIEEEEKKKKNLPSGVCVGFGTFLSDL